MFEATLVADSDRHRQQRLLLAAAIAMSSTSTALAGLWTLERLGIDRVIGPRQQFELLQLDMLTPPKPLDPPPPPPEDDRVIEAAAGTTTTHADAANDEDDATPSNMLTQPQPRSNTIPGPNTGGIPASAGCPGGLCIGSLPTKNTQGCTGPLCVGTSPLPPKAAPAPTEVEFSALRCLACTDPDQAALRKAVVGGQGRRGSVTVKFCVDQNGRVEGTSIKVSRSFGVAAVDRITVDTMKRWRFSPLEIGGKSRRACSRAVFNIRFE